jgi:adenylate cyclase
MTKSEKFLVEFVNEKQFYVLKNQSILQASLAAGIPHFHACGGKAKCSTCRVLVLEGGKSLTKPNQKEKVLKNKMQLSQQVRLACQTHITGGPVKMKRIIQDETDIDLYVDKKGTKSTQKMGEEAELILCFLDIRNFTRFVETHLPFDVIHIIRKLFAVFQNHIESNSGKIIETAGDGLYAVFGSGTDNEKHAERAMAAAYSIFSELEKMNRDYFVNHFNQRIDVGIGMHVGKVISGSIRRGDTEHTIVMGYPVNVASRLQNATKTLNNNFIVSAAFYHLLQQPPMAPFRSIRAQGISKTLRVFLMGRAYGPMNDAMSVLKRETGLQPAAGI